MRALLTRSCPLLIQLNVLLTLLLWCGQSWGLNLRVESVAGVYIGEELLLLQQRIGQPEKRSPELYDQQDRCKVQVLFYERIGVEVEVCERDGVRRVRSLRATDDSVAKTSYQCRVGDSVAKLRAAYPMLSDTGGGVWSIEDRQHQITLSFFIEDEHIVEISLMRHPGANGGTRLQRRRAYR
ncbi:MAG: hypothetical protein VYD19_08930 [Myxococcota bacterium]|nr:hypothetical protein [Myxococcota bacterium]